MNTPITTLSALNAIMTYCGSHANEAASLVIAYQQDPVEAQKQAKDLAKRVIAAGDIGSMPVDTIRGLALWAATPIVTVADSSRTVLHCRVSAGEKILLQELADGETEGNITALIMKAIKAYIGIDW